MATPAFWTASGVRWLAFAALAALLGALVSETAILVGDSVEMDAARRRLTGWSVLSGVALLVATIAEFIVRVQTMTGGPFAATIDAVPTVLSRTHFGPIWVARAGLLVATIALCRRPSRRPRVMALVATAGVALTTSLTGHAAHWGDLSISVAADWVHVVASGIWAGGLFALAWVVFRERAARPSLHLAPAMMRFSRLAGFCVLAVVLSGFYNSSVQVGSIRALGTTGYGRVLLVKALIVVVLVYLGAGNRYALLPRLTGTVATGPGARLFKAVHSIARGARQGPGRAVRCLVARVRTEAILALVVLACAAILAETTPARHAGHPRHPPEPETGRGSGGSDPAGAGTATMHDSRR